MANVLLQLGDEFLLVVQLVSQATDLFLVGLAVGVDLLIHGFLDTHTHTHRSDIQPIDRSDIHPTGQHERLTAPLIH